MWLLPAFGLLSRLICAIFYRLRVSGERPDGPVLLIANHPNALLDPLLVVVAAGRPVRFLAKAPLFDQAGIGWLVRAVGSIPVYRPSDFPGEERNNEDMFEAAFRALDGGAAIGLFPEGTSHSDPGLKPLKTGAARIALGCARATGCRPLIVPVGLVLRSKQTFRSEALAVLGTPVRWDDLSGGTETAQASAAASQDQQDVRELTRRIDGALRRVTVNLEAWEDRPMVETAEAIYRVELLAGGTGGDELEPEQARLERLAVATKILRERRQNVPLEDPDLAGDLDHYARELQTLGLTPSDVAVSQTLARSLRWLARRLYLVGLPSILAAVVGYVLFWVPYRLTGMLSERLSPSIDQLQYGLVDDTELKNAALVAAAAAARAKASLILESLGESLGQVLQISGTVVQAGPLSYDAGRCCRDGQS